MPEFLEATYSEVIVHFSVQSSLSPDDATLWVDSKGSRVRTASLVNNPKENPRVHVLWTEHISLFWAVIPLVAM